MIVWTTYLHLGFVLFGIWGYLELNDSFFSQIGLHVLKFFIVVYQMVDLSEVYCLAIV